MAEQRKDYERRLFEAERARLACAAEVERVEAAAEAAQLSLQRRVQRLERAAARVPGPGRRAPKERPGDSKSPWDLAARVRSSVGSVGEVVERQARDLRWRVPVADLFDAGATRLRPEVLDSFDRLAEVLAPRPRVSMSIEVGRTDGPSSAGAAPGWREASERGVALLAAVQQRGIAPARLTLIVSGAVPDGLIVFSISRARGRGRR